MSDWVDRYFGMVVTGIVVCLVIVCLPVLAPFWLVGRVWREVADYVGEGP